MLKTALRKEYGGQGIIDRRPRHPGRAPHRRPLTELARLVVSGVLDPHVTDVRPLSDAAAALAIVEEGHNTGKVVLVP